MVQKKIVMNDIMIDNETLDTTPGAVIISIGAVKFNKMTGVLGDKFYAVLDIEEQKLRGRTVSDDTVAWWAKQSEEARIALTTKDRRPVHDIMSELWDFIGGTWNDDFTNTKPSQAKIWGNGSDFDNPQIASLFTMYGFDLPWMFWNNRCFRTMKSEFRHLCAEPARGGTYHNALDDAIHQAVHCQMIYGELNKLVKGIK